ncbi:aldo/keto reductase [Pelovirga terrestris]|uniref:Aldo/keto reductase n=1 Tax=Pelovirga terrestris TaxID=2771352 RepID=A0A8J6QNV2_9BACT|nr:aldo/keto reductase [Pelovirga terrestris]MBD1401212.1 aldo/keto reductase [Pelovirga terrestris]
MIYRPFGRTGTELSIVSFGGMRFPEPDKLEASAELVRYAWDRGINYFDTAPLYCDQRSETILGHALKGLPRADFHVGTKCFHASGSELRRSLEQSLELLQLDTIDFFYIWYLLDRDDWHRRLDQGAVAAALQAKEEGLIKNLVCSSHMNGDDLAEVLAGGYFSGVLLGYNAINFPYRQAAVEHAGKQGLGVITMNPLGGGLIPRNPQRFSFLQGHQDQSVVSAALRFNLSHPSITSALVGFTSAGEIDEAVAAVDNFAPYSAAERSGIEKHLNETFNDLCTGCGYCLPCPVNIPIPKFLDAYNQLILSEGDSKTVSDRFRLHWNIDRRLAAECIRCGACEERCTQHLPVIQRLTELAGDSTQATDQNK